MKYFLMSLTMLILFACSASKQVQQPENNVQTEKYDESFDPNSLNDDDIVIAKHDEPLAAANKNDTDLNTADEEVAYKEANGFRVQILATKNIETATVTEQEAKDLFQNSNHKVYLIFDAPLYKVRVGDVTSRDSAEEIRDIAKDYGFKEAFIVPSKVNIPANSSF